MMEEILRRAEERVPGEKISDIVEFYIDVTKMSEDNYRENGATEEDIRELWEDADLLIADLQKHEVKTR